MLSMTGFGLAEARLGDGRLSVEVRALNHRHQDVRVRLPSTLAEHSFYVEQLARTRLGRGRYDIGVRAEGTIGGQPTIQLERAEGVLRGLMDLRSRVCPEAVISVDAVLSLPDVVSCAGPDPELIQEVLAAAFEGAVVQLQKMRHAEGLALKLDLQARIELLSRLTAELESGAGALVTHQRSRLKERVELLLSGVAQHIDTERLEQEIALLADKSDITEELVRLRSHLDQFTVLLEVVEPVGRRMDFLLQELGREVNTIGSKSQHAPLAHLVVAAKAEVERLREQVQNVE